LEQAAGIKVMCGYGLTETSPVIAIRRSNDNFIDAGVVGRPPRKVELRIVHPETREVLPLTHVGEVTTRGPQVSMHGGSVTRIGVVVRLLTSSGLQVMKGYYKNPEATAKVTDKEGWFSTGKPFPIPILKILIY